MVGIHWTEIVFGAATFVVLTTYHIYWGYHVRKAPLQTYRGISRYLRRMWVESIMTGRRDILSVQTLRNWIMASSFLASTAMIIGLGLLSLLFRPEHVTEVPFEFTLIFSRMKTLFLAKLMLLMMHFFFAFFSFTLSIRYMNQINFMINVPIECDPLLTPDFIAHTLDLGMLHYTMGMRAFYLSVVAALWLFGPVWMFLGSLILTFVLYKLDHCYALDYSTAECDIKTHGIQYFSY
ncbi:MAG: DUF599 domain-containing protein [Deltaproteobacteria bacterium]|nr:DUF599 domain-containing protein [Deltaproteobacteria bacterium]